MPPLKDELGPAAAKRLAVELASAWPDFPARRFTHGIASALEPLELLARTDLLAERLVAALPASFSEAGRVLWRALDSTTFDGWITLPCGGFAARAGIDEPDVALPLLAGLTSRFSAEWPIRAFIEHHRDRTYEQLQIWCTHDDEHVRRLVSEGTRPRLPWAPQLRELIADPAPNLPLLDALVDDRSPYVRRSVANHLNDISKDHPALALEVAARWMGRGDGARWVVRHGLRTLVKRGDTTALSLLGVATEARIRLVELAVDRDRIAVGDAAEITFTLVLEDTNGPVEAVIDYRVHYVGARGVKAPKVFKLARRRLESGQPVTFTRRHPFEHVSIRRIHPGKHTIDLQVNGKVLGSTTVEVA